MTPCIRRAHSRWTTCRCETCAPDFARTAKLARNGRLRRVPSADALAVFTHWLALGYSPSWIASAAGVPARYAENLAVRVRAGEVPLIGPTRSAQLVALDITTATQGHGPIAGTTRRLQALAVLGYTLEAIRDRTGIPMMSLSYAQSGRLGSVSAQRWAIVRDLYEEIGLRQGPSRNATARALRRGWVGPLAWDDDSMDDPNVQPAPARNDATHKFAGRPQADVVEDVAWLIEHDAALTSQQAADRLGMRVDSLQQALRRAGQHDLAQQLALNAELTNTATGRRSA